MADLHGAIAAAPDAILIPKVSVSGDITGTAKVVKAADADPRIRLWAMIETPMGIINAQRDRCVRSRSRQPARLLRARHQRSV